MPLNFIFFALLAAILLVPEKDKGKAKANVERIRENRSGRSGHSQGGQQRSATEIAGKLTGDADAEKVSARETKKGTENESGKD